MARKLLKRKFKRSKTRTKKRMELDKLKVTRKYISDTLYWTGSYTRYMTLTNNGIFYAVKGLRMSNAYDPDSQLGNVGVTGFDKWAEFYNNYRVISTKIRVDAINIENNSVEVNVFPSNQYYADNATSFNSIQPRDQRYNKRIVLGPASTGNDKGRISHGISISTLFGRKLPDMVMEGTTDGNVNPLQAAYWYIYCRVIKEGTGFESLKGVQLVLSVDYRLKFYRPKNLTSYAALSVDDKFDIVNQDMTMDDMGDGGAAGATGYVGYTTGATGL